MRVKQDIPTRFKMAMAMSRNCARKRSTTSAPPPGDMHNMQMTEIDAMNGAVVRAGRKLGVPTPVNEAVTNFVHLLEATRQTACSHAI